MSKILKKCLVCKKEFYVYPYRVLLAKYCSHKCYSKIVYLQPKTDRWYEAMKKTTPWNKGKRWSKEVIEKLKISQKKRYKNQSAWNKGLKGFRAKEKSHLWKGGITPQNRLERIRFRNEIQQKVLERDLYTCQICGARGVHLQVDHIQSWAKYVKGRFDINNCRTLCMKCHYEITFGKSMPIHIKVWGHNLKEVVSH